MLRKIVSVFLLAAVLFGLDFNTASKDELMSIKGIGNARAEAIIKYRQENKIDSIDDLVKVPGFGLKSVEKIKDELKNNDKVK